MISTPAHVDHVRIFILNSEICHRKRSLSPKSRLLEVPIFDRELELFGDGLWLLLAGLLILGILVGVVAGLYPAFVLSGFNTSEALKQKVPFFARKALFRRALVIVQFSASTGLIIVILSMHRQVKFMTEADLGFEPSQVIVVPLNLEDSHEKIDGIRSSFTSIPGVHSVTTSSQVPGEGLSRWSMNIEGDPTNFLPCLLFADEHFAETMDIEMVEGRFLSSDFPRDAVDNYVVNEAFLREANIKGSPIGKGAKFTWHREYGQIIGVMKDFHYQALHTKIRPLAISGRQNREYASFKISTQEIRPTTEQIEEVWAEVEPAHPMRFTFLDDDFARQYTEHERLAMGMTYASVITIIIALMGLFGLVTYSAKRRAKEIGIRKILGASIAGIVGMLSKEYLSLILVALVIATPISAYLMYNWLADFAYRIDLEWWIFAAAGLATIFIAFCTTSLQSVKAAMANPVESLRDE